MYPGSLTRVISFSGEIQNKFRMGTYYPAEDDHCFNSTKCPLFWQYHKVPVIPVNFTNEDYIDKIRIAAMTGMSFNILAVIITTILLINDLRKNDSFVKEVEEMDKPKDNSVALTAPSTSPDQPISESVEEDSEEAMEEDSDQNPDHVRKSGPIWIFRPSMLVGVHK